MVVFALKASHSLAKTLWCANGLGSVGINGHSDNMTTRNEPLRFRLEDGEFESKAGIADFPYPGMDMENLVKKGSVVVLAK